MPKPDGIAPLIPWYVNGTLGAKERESVELHLPKCASCRELEAQARMAIEIGRDPSRDELLNHVHAQLLDEWVASPGSLERGTRAWIEQHLQSCDACAEESRILVQVRRLEREGEESGAGVISSLVARANELLRGVFSLPLLDVRRPLVSAAVSAGLMFLVLGYPTYLGLRRLPEVARQVEGVRHEMKKLSVESEERVQSLTSDYEHRITELEKATSWSGAVDIALLLPTTRGDSAAQRVKIASDQPYVLLAVELDPEDIVPSRGEYQFEISSEGKVAWAKQLSAALVRKSLEDAQGVVVLLIPSTVLGPGTYSLRFAAPEFGQRVRALRRPDPLIEKKFEIVRY